MTAHDCTASTAVSKSISYPCLINSQIESHRVAEDTDDYTTNPLSSDELTWSMKRIELLSLRKTASAQVGRLYQLVNLLTKP